MAEYLRGVWRIVVFLRTIVAVVVIVVAVAVSAQESVSPTHEATENQTGVEASTPANLVIRNVYLIGRQSADDDVLVSLVILDGALQVVTRDEVPPAPRSAPSTPEEDSSSATSSWARRLVS